MGRIVSRSYVVDLVNQLYVNQQNICHFCQKSTCIFCCTTYSFEQQLRKKKSNTENSKISDWFIINLKENTNKITIFPL